MNMTPGCSISVRSLTRTSRGWPNSTRYLGTLMGIQRSNTTSLVTSPGSLLAFIGFGNWIATTRHYMVRLQTAISCCQLLTNSQLTRGHCSDSPTCRAMIFFWRPSLLITTVTVRTPKISRWSIVTNGRPTLHRPLAHGPSSSITPSPPTAP